ncbi:MAG: excinuclease ABC subunit C [Bacteroides sp. SM23_62_1]|nr:MAG: excinuclease ABC subunit C [Bacteroides sp. SM23_62_1]
MNVEYPHIDYLKSLIEVIPDKPGIYQFISNQGEILYVGKARNLKKRVSSYFTRNKPENNKLRILIKKTAEIKHFVVSDESDALLLENNLIKKHQPRYNVLLKDDKTFPWICVKNELFPRVFITRNVIRDGSIYYGPYTSVTMVKTLLDLIRQLFPIRNCKLNLSEENIKQKKFKACLEYHMGNCKAPCEGLQTRQDYEEALTQIHEILKGNIFQVVEYLKKLMDSYAKTMEFEQAQLVKQKIEILEKYRSKSTIVNPKIKDAEVYSIADEKHSAYINYLKVINGSVVQTQTLELKKRLDESVPDLLSMAIIEIRQRTGSQTKEIIVPQKIDLAIQGANFTVPLRGDKKHLLNLSERNAKFYQLEKRKQMELMKPEMKISRKYATIMKDLYLADQPDHIECFDNSNIQGKNPVAACVVFKKLKPSRKDYRHFNIKTVTGPNDYESMEEVIFRRYQRILNENGSLPKLIIIDGGKGQLNAALKSIEKLGLRGKIAVIGIAKRLEEICFPGDSVPLYIDKNSETLKIIQQIRNEAHRFGVKFHRNKRSKDMIVSELDHIEGIGEKTREKLLLSFGSVKAIKNADKQEIIDLIGERKTHILLQGLRNK